MRTLSTKYILESLPLSSYQRVCFEHGVTVHMAASRRHVSSRFTLIFFVHFLLENAWWWWSYTVLMRCDVVYGVMW